MLSKIGMSKEQRAERVLAPKKDSALTKMRKSMAKGEQKMLQKIGMTKQ